jgi:hypothetical protein
VFARIAISLVAGIAIVLHLVFPQVQLDLPTMVLALVAIAPWLAPIFKSVELPGGFKIELQDVQRATLRVTTSPEPASEPIAGSAEPEAAEQSVTPMATRGYFETRLANLEALAKQDPNLSLVALRIEIESTLRAIARATTSSGRGNLQAACSISSTRPVSSRET